MAENDVVSRVSAAPRPPSRPTITLPPRAAIENLFTSFAGFSPGPMTLVSSFFAENTPDSGFRSFSQLLAGAMASPAAAEISKGGAPSSVLNNSDVTSSTTDGGEKNFGGNFVFPHSPLFTVPPGLSPSGLLGSPGLFSPGQSPFGMSHQQALAQVTAQAALSQSRMHIQAGYQQSSLTASAESVTNHPSFTTSATTHQQMPLLRCDPKSSTTESSEICHPEEKPLPTSIALDKPADDGYNWRKYGQKQVKGSEYPRSYYKCTHPNCPVKKKVERSLEGRIIEIIYKGQHNHEMPQPNKRAKDVSGLNGNNNSQTKPKFGALVCTGNLNMSNVTVPAQPAPGKDQETSQATSVLSVESSDSEDVGDAETREENCNDNGEPNPKRRNTEVGVSEPAPLHKTVAEPRIIVQTRSEVDLLDDGYKWRKYGQKVVKGNPNPRSYYKCTSAGCKVRKHVERASTDAKAVITTYEGKHSHDVPAGRNNSHNTANSNALALQIKPQKVVAVKHASVAKIDFENKEQRRVSVLQLKEEQVKV